jgi:hypothetical protein
MRRSPGLARVSPARFDWRGWIALAWVLWWGWAYALMAVRARGPQVVAWIRSLWSAAN